MTKPNVYGISAEVAYDFDGWTWEDRSPGLVERISREAGETILKEMAKDSHIWIDSNDAGKCIIEFSCFDGHVCFTILLSEAIDKWLRSRGADDDKVHPDDAKELVAALELAWEKIKAHIRPS